MTFEKTKGELDMILYYRKEVSCLFRGQMSAFVFVFFLFISYNYTRFHFLIIILGRQADVSF